MELKIEKTLSKRVQVSNAGDAEKEYDISASVNASNGAVDNIENGVVSKDGTQKATFSQYSANNKNINFNCESTEEEAVLGAINEFVDALPTAIKEA